MKPVNRRNAQAYQKAGGNWKKKYRQIVKEKKKKGGGGGLQHIRSGGEKEMIKNLNTKNDNR